MKKSIVGIVVANLVLFVVTASSFGAEKQETEYVKQGPYVGVSLIQNYMSGDFDGTGFVFVPGAGNDPNLAIDVPHLDDGLGFGVVLGWRQRNRSWELGYQRTIHDTTSAFVEFGDSQAAFNVIDLNLKLDVFARNKLRPYVLIGAGIPWITIEDGQIDIDNAIYHDGTYAGVCLNGGAGLAYYIKPQWAVTGGVLYRYNWFTSVEEIGLDTDLTESTVGLTLGVAYTF